MSDSSVVFPHHKLDAYNVSVESGVSLHRHQHRGEVGEAAACIELAAARESHLRGCRLPRGHGRHAPGSHLHRRLPQDSPRHTRRVVPGYSSPLREGRNREARARRARRHEDEGQREQAQGRDKRGDELPEAQRDRQSRLCRIEEARAELEAEALAARKAELAEREASKQVPPDDPPPPTLPEHQVRHDAAGNPAPDAQRNFTDSDSIGVERCLSYSSYAAGGGDGQQAPQELLPQRLRRLSTTTTSAARLRIRATAPGSMRRSGRKMPASRRPSVSTSAESGNRTRRGPLTSTRRPTAHIDDVLRSHDRPRAATGVRGRSCAR